jgi:signal transduction histidine kinase/DNA-binding response OmpR family regulator
MAPRFLRQIRVGTGLLVAVATGAAEPPRGLFHPEAGRPVFRDFRPTDYRGHPQVFEITQGPDGFIYVANQEGILEFDGARWTHCPGPGAQFTRVRAAPDGKIWAGGTDAFGFYQRNAAGVLEFNEVSRQLPQELKPWGWNSTLLLDGDAVYFAGSRGIARYQGGQLTTWRTPDNSAPRLHLVDGEVLVHLGRSGLHRLTAGGLEPYVTNVDLSSLGSRSVSARLPNGRYLLCLSGGGAFLLEPSTRTLTRLPGVLDDALRAGRVNAALALSDGSLAVGTAAQGLFLLSADLRQVRQLDRTSGLADNAIIALAPDNEGGLWIGYNSGLARISITSPVTVFDGSNGPTPGTIDAWGRHAGRLYVGTYDGLYRLEPGPTPAQGARFIRITDKVSHIFGLESYDGRLLIAESKGLQTLREDDTTELVVRTGTDNPYALVRSPRIPGRFYLGTSGGLTVVQHDANGWRIVTQRSGLGEAHTSLVDEHGDLWLACYDSGFWRVPEADLLTDWSRASYEQYFAGRGIPLGITWTNVTPGARGPIYFSGRGAQRFDRAKNEFVPEDRYVLPGDGALMFTPSAVSGRDTWTSAFKDNTIAALYPLGRLRETAAGLVWQTAPSEVLQEIGFAGAAVIWIESTPTGNVLWARGYNNTIRLDLSALPEKTPTWQTLIRFLIADGRRLAPRQDARLAYSRSPLVFELAAPHLSAIDGIRFQTRLLGFDDEWSSPTTEPRVSFTNLEGGPFTLEARAIDASGSVSRTAQYTFSVAPPWQRSTLAYALYVLVGVAAVGLFVRGRLAASRREQARLEQLVRHRTAELATARDQAEAASRAKSTFLAHMSHELRTPLNGIIGYTQVLLKDTQVAGRQRERVNIVHTSGQHLLRMINEVLDFSKIEAGKIERQDAPFDLAQLLRELVVAHEAAATARGLAFRCEVPSDLPPRLMGDAQKLRQILDNLLSNAVKFTRQGDVSLSLALVGRDTWRFAIQDTGVGLSADDRARLFQPFEQARQRRPAEPGTGLGLAITQRLVHLLGGKLAVDSAPDRGSSFSFTLELPPAVDPSRGPVLGPIVGYSGPRRRVIVVDDTPINRALLTDLLTPLGFSVREFASAEEMLSAPATELSADLAFLDLKMPGIDGLELARRLRARPDTRMLPLVMTSASVLTFDRAAAARAGCHEFLPKPFSDQQLEEILTRTLSLAWLRATPVAPLAPTSAPLPATLAAELLALADSGDIAALRRAVDSARRQQPENALLASVEQAVADYQLERARQLLASAI